MFLHVDSEDSDQIGHFVGFVMWQFNYRSAVGFIMRGTWIEPATHGFQGKHVNH